MVEIKVTAKLDGTENRNELHLLADEGVTVEFVGGTAVYTVRAELADDAAGMAWWLEDALHATAGVTGVDVVESAG